MAEDTPYGLTSGMTGGSFGFTSSDIDDAAVVLESKIIGGMEALIVVCVLRT